MWPVGVQNERRDSNNLFSTCIGIVANAHKLQLYRFRGEQFRNYSEHPSSSAAAAALGWLLLCCPTTRLSNTYRRLGVSRIRTNERAWKKCPRGERREEDRLRLWASE